MNVKDEFSSSEDEFCFESFQSDGDAICGDSENSDEDDNVVPAQKCRVVGSEAESDSDGSQTDSTQPSYNTGWTPCDENAGVLPRMEFKTGGRRAGPQVPSDVKEPVDFLKIFFTEELVNEIVRETNSYAENKLKENVPSSRSLWKTWYNLTSEEFWAFIGVVVNMGTMPLANMQEYWSTNPVSHIPFFSNTFTRNRFVQIFWMLRLKMVPGQAATTIRRVKLISGYLDYIDSRLLEHYTPNEEICVNESVVNSDGRVTFIRYNPKMKTKWSIRMYTLVDSNTGYVCGILPYYGCLTKASLPRPDLPLTSRIPLHLYSKLQSRVPGAEGYHMFTDRCFTSYVLADELYKLKCHLTGEITVQGRRLPGGKSVAAYRKFNNLILAWRDKKEITLLTNWHNPEMSTVQGKPCRNVQTVVRKPNAIVNYSKSMVYVSGRYTSQYCFVNKALKWWRKLFFWGLEICLINSYILYRLVKKQRNEEPLKHLQFKKTLVSQLRGNFRQPRERASTSTNYSDEVRLDGKLHLLLSGKKKDCRVCSRRTLGGSRHETNYYCDTCPDKPRMHLGQCFVNYHTKVNYRT